METEQDVFGTFIKKRRQELCFTSKKVAEIIGVKPSLYSMWESNKRKPRLDSPAITKLANLFDMPQVDLVKVLACISIRPGQQRDILSLLRIVVNSTCQSVTLEELVFLVELSDRLKISEELIPTLLQNRILPKNDENPVER